MTRGYRIGVYAGTFDPVHSGHVGFALQARDIAGLDEVCFIPERLPRHKPGVEHYAHRVAMLRQAIRPYSDLSLLELADKRLSVQRSLPKLKQIFPEGTRFVLLMGADVFMHVPEWPHQEQLFRSCEFTVSVRSHNELTVALQTVQQYGLPAHSVTILDSVQPDVSSTQMRQAIRLNVPIKGLLPSVRNYARREWLYASVR